MKEAAHVGVVHPGGRRGVHHGNVPEALRDADLGVGAGDGFARAFHVAGVDEHRLGPAAALGSRDRPRLFLVVVADNDLVDLRAEGKLSDGPAAHGADADDGDPHEASSRTLERGTIWA